MHKLPILVLLGVPGRHPPRQSTARKVNFPLWAQGRRSYAPGMDLSVNRNVVTAALAAVVIVGVGYGGYRFVKERADQRAVVEVVAETTSQLREALKTASPEAAGKIDEKLEVARSWSNVYMADAAEHYLVGAREIAKRRSDAARHAQRFTAARRALSAHMNRAGARDSSWIRTASQLKKEVDQAHFELETSLNALAELLQSLPEAQKRLEVYVDASLTLEEGVRRKAREQVLDEVMRAKLQLQDTRLFGPR